MDENGSPAPEEVVTTQPDAVITRAASPKRSIEALNAQVADIPEFDMSTLEPTQPEDSRKMTVQQAREKIKDWPETKPVSVPQTKETPTVLTNSNGSLKDKFKSILHWK